MSEWISVKERLPEILEDLYYSDDVLAIDDDGEIMIASLWAIHKGATPQWTSDRVLPIITHWMPLPEPPQREE